MYQPLITDENIQRLYRMKLREKRPMTRLINQILGDFFQTYEHQKSDERREPTWIQLDQTDSPSRPSAWLSASNEFFNPD